MSYVWSIAQVVVLVPWVLLTACAPSVQIMGPQEGVAKLERSAFVTRDGLRLPLKVWSAAKINKHEKAVILGLHGFNMYSNHFEDAATWWAKRGITTYAYDQRGFGGTPNKGIWAGRKSLVTDAIDVIGLLKERHPKSPIYLLGDSMGGAVAILAQSHLYSTRSFFEKRNSTLLDGLILVAPATWGGKSMNSLYFNGLSVAAHLMPWNYATSSNLSIKASDNQEMLMALGKDPLVIKHTRIDALYGLVKLMRHAVQKTPLLGELPVLVLYGLKDDIIPKVAIKLFLKSIVETPQVYFYENGYHMLLRDRQASFVWRDISTWILNPERWLCFKAMNEMY